MTAAARARRREPFGDGLRERMTRRLAGAGAATLVLGAALAWMPAAVLLAAGTLYLVGVPLSFLLEARWPVTGKRAVIARYVGLGSAVASLVVTVLAAPDFAYLWILLAFAAPCGAIGGGVAAWAALRLRGRWVSGTAVAGIVAIAVAAGGVWLDTRPPEPHDFLLVPTASPEAARAFGDARGLGREVAGGFERAAHDGRPRLAHRTWTDVADALLDRRRGDSELWAHFERALVTRSDGTQVRLITVGLGEDRACVVVTREGTTVTDQRCAALDVAEEPR